MITLLIREITFRLSQNTIIIHQRYRQTDRQHTTEIPVLCAVKAMNDGLKFSRYD